MKSEAERKFDHIIKEAFTKNLKPLGFKKRANNFYLPLEGVGQMINLQKSTRYSKNHIHFTINAGIFLPEFWLAYYNYHNKPIPDYPTEPECAARARIGRLRNDGDIWYDVDEDTDEIEMIIEMEENLNDYILPFFLRLKSKDQFLSMLDTDAISLPPFGKLIVYAELKQTAKARVEFNRLKALTIRPEALKTLLSYAEKYKLD